MKKLLYILIFFVAVQPVFAQEEKEGEVRLREKLVEYVQAKLGLSRPEAEKFQPIFVNYFKELKRTNREYKGQGLELQQKVVEVRLRYREQFKPIVGEKRSNEVFDHEREFVQKVKAEMNDRRQERLERRADRGKNSKLLSN